MVFQLSFFLPSNFLIGWYNLRLLDLEKLTIMLSQYGVSFLPIRQAHSS